MLSRMRRIILLLIALVAAGVRPFYAQSTCPVMLFDGASGRDSITLSFMNKGKIPIQQLVLSCKPSPKTQAKGAACHTEDGLFYPGTPYSIKIPYPDASHHPVTLTLKTAFLAGGVVWKSTPGQACRPLTVLKKR